ncbi:MAG: HpsJ family protein [Synechococcaceae cyanobacterium]|nr:HpsJ family protein [Synechococcaceae cyanobacterium]
MLARRLGIIAIALFVLFAASVLARIIPVSLLTPSWQLEFSAALIDAAPSALLGLILLHLAYYLDPQNAALKTGRTRAANLCIAVALGYLLLLPLNTYAVWSGLSNLQATKTRVEADAARRVSQFRTVISAASSAQDLQERLQSLGVPGLKASDLRKPLPLLKERLLENIDKAERNLSSKQANAGATVQLGSWSVLQSALKLGVSSLALAVAFAAAAQRGNDQTSLIDAWQRKLKKRSKKTSSR